MERHLSGRNAFFLVVIMLIGTNNITGLPLQLKQDNWLALLFSLLPVSLTMLAFARLLTLMPGQDLFRMAETVLGPRLGRLVSFIFTAYMVHLASLALDNITEFVHLTSLFNTPKLLIALVIGIPIIYLAKNGSIALGKWAAIMFVVSLLIAGLDNLIAFSAADPSHLQPLMEHSLPELASASLRLVSYPFGEIIVISAAFMGSLRRDANPYKIYLGGVTVAAFLLILGSIRTTAVLGAEYAAASFFASYRAVSILKLGSFLQRIEALSGFAAILLIHTKIAACLIAASRGLMHIFSTSGETEMTVPLGLLAIALSTMLSANNLQLFEVLKFYTLYAAPIQLLLPGIIWLGAEIKHRSGRLKTS